MPSSNKPTVTLARWTKFFKAGADSSAPAKIESLNAKGVEFTREPVNLSWGIGAAYFKDPEGNIWEIAQAL
jgi:uncharacterized glyoxalase superfamily protein PhnB